MNGRFSASPRPARGAWGVGERGACVAVMMKSNEKQARPPDSSGHVWDFSGDHNCYLVLQAWSISIPAPPE